MSYKNVAYVISSEDVIDDTHFRMNKIYDPVTDKEWTQEPGREFFYWHNDSTIITFYQDVYKEKAGSEEGMYAGYVRLATEDIDKLKRTHQYSGFISLAESCVEHGFAVYLYGDW